MNYQTLLQYIDTQIVSLVKKGDKTSLGNYRHHKSALNAIVKKYGLVKEELISIYFHDKFEELLDSYKLVLISSKRSDVRSPQTRLRKLRDLYLSLTDIEVYRTPVSDMLTQAAKRMFGEKLYTAEITPKTQQLIANQHMTIRQLATDIVVTGVKKNPAMWPKVDLKTRQSIASASKVLRDYFTGDSVPSERVPSERILYIEEYLGLPKGALLSKIIRKQKLAANSAMKKKRRSTARNKMENCHERYGSILKLKNLNEPLNSLFNDYKNFKVKGIQPKVVNISSEIFANPRLRNRLKVSESTRRSEKGWTVNGFGHVPSADIFFRNLIFFYNYCVQIENIPEDKVCSSQMTDIDLLFRMTEYVKFNNKHGSSAERVLSFISLGIQKFGYLKLCGDLGGRSKEDFFDDLEYIKDE